LNLPIPLIRTYLRHVQIDVREFISALALIANVYAIIAGNNANTYLVWLISYDDMEHHAKIFKRR
jgi:hypothetical protein